jgi:hypothetical protein
VPGRIGSTSHIHNHHKGKINPPPEDQQRDIHPRAFFAGGFFPALAVSAVVFEASFLFFVGADDKAFILLVAVTMRFVP